jgi:hypothetical protein
VDFYPGDTGFDSRPCYRLSSSFFPGRPLFLQANVRIVPLYKSWLALPNPYLAAIMIIFKFKTMKCIL